MQGKLGESNLCIAQANMSAADSLQEMLLRSGDGILHVFPAIPKHWSREGAAGQASVISLPVSN